MNTPKREDALTLEILEAIEERSDVTQRSLAQSSGVALGLANSYLKRCVRKGLVKIQQAPANRYLYYLTPKGFAEKSRLTAEYLSYSFTFYRKATNSCMDALHECRDAGHTTVGLYGFSELAEIICLRAPESGVQVAALVDPQRAGERFRGELVSAAMEPANMPDAWILTDLGAPHAALDAVLDVAEPALVFVPSVLGLRR